MFSSLSWLELPNLGQRVRNAIREPGTKAQTNISDLSGGKDDRLYVGVSDLSRGAGLRRQDQRAFTVALRPLRPLGWRVGNTDDMQRIHGCVESRSSTMETTPLPTAMKSRCGTELRPSRDESRRKRSESRSRRGSRFNMVASCLTGRPGCRIDTVWPPLRFMASRQAQGTCVGPEPGAA